ncbi:MAG TPA: transposase [Leptospiraceae bacterium]|nr:transposase [Leptospiraceae bacterium]
MGIDLNSTSNTIVTANSLTGNVKKYGKEIPFLKKKYKNLRRKNQINGNLKLIAKQSKKERNKTKDILQKITTKIVKEAVKTNCGLKIENLKGISKHNLKKYKSESNHTLNSWPFYEIRRLLKYKSLLLGVKLEIVDPAFTSQSCFQCKQINKENRKGKIYKCSCGHLEHSDANAAFNISLKECFSIVPSSNLEKNDKVLKTGESVFYTLAPRLNLPLKARVS